MELDAEQRESLAAEEAVTDLREMAKALHAARWDAVQKMEGIKRWEAEHGDECHPDGDFVTGRIVGLDYALAMTTKALARYAAFIARGDED